MPVTVVARAATTTSMIRESPVGGRPPFEVSCIKVGVGDGINIGVWVIIGLKGIIIGVGIGVEVGEVLCVGIAAEVVGVGTSAAKTVNDCIIVVKIPDESRVFIVIV
jgi:hypothetical protein